MSDLRATEERDRCPDGQVCRPGAHHVPQDLPLGPCVQNIVSIYIYIYMYIYIYTYIYI